MKENKYDDNILFQKYSQMSRSQQGLAGAGEWETLRKLLPDFKDKRVLDLGCGYGWHCIYAKMCIRDRAWEWFVACLEGKGKNISPFEIYFTDKKENRIAVDGVTISLSDALKNSSAFSLNSKGTLKTLSVQSRNGQMIFQADGSYYYILAEKTEQDIPNEPTTQPTTQTGADNSTDVNHAGSGAASGAKTGDDTPLELYMVLLFVGLITTSIAGLCRKKNYVAKQK